MASDPFDELQPVAADPFDSLEPATRQLLPPNAPSENALRDAFFRRQFRPTDPLTNLLYGAGETLAGPVQFGAEVIDTVAGTDLARRFERRVLAPVRERYYGSDAPFTMGAEPMREIGHAAPWLFVRRLPGGETASRLVANVPVLRRPGVQTAIGDAAAGAVVGGLSYVPEGESRLEEAQTGAVAGLVGGGLVRGLTGAVTRITNALRNRMRPETEPVLETGQRYGVRLSATDVAPAQNPARTRAAIRAEHSTLTGVPAFRQAQAEEVTRAAHKLQQRYEGDFLDDWPSAAQASLTTRLQRMKAVIGAKYDRLAELAAGKSQIVPLHTVEYLDDALAKEKSRVLPDKALIAQLEDLRTTLHQGPTDFARLRDFRSDLGLELKGFYSGQNKLIGMKGAEVFARLRHAVDRDMESWAKAQGGDILKAWRDADESYRRMASVYRHRQIAALKDITDPNELYTRFKTLAARSPQTLYNALGPEGRRAIQYGVVQDAIRAASRTTPAGEVVSAARLAAQLEKQQRSLGVVFGKDAAEIEGFIKLMRAAERSGQFMEYPPTGVRSLFTLGQFARGGSYGVAYMLAGWYGVGTVATIEAARIGMARILFTTPAGRRMLLAAKHLDPRGEAIKKVLTDRLPQVVAAHVTAEDFVPFRKVDETALSPELLGALSRAPVGTGVLDEATGEAYAMDASGAIRRLD